jgi:hypothetical protein
VATDGRLIGKPLRDRILFDQEKIRFSRKRSPFLSDQRAFSKSECESVAR